MSLATIRLRRAVNLVVHIQDQGQDRATAVAAHIPVAAVAAVVDILPILVADRHHMAAVEVHRRMVAEAAIAIRNRLPATADLPWSLLQGLLDQNRKSDGQPTVALFCF